MLITVSFGCTSSIQHVVHLFVIITCHLLCALSDDINSKEARHWEHTKHLSCTFPHGTGSKCLMHVFIILGGLHNIKNKSLMQ